MKNNAFSILNYRYNTPGKVIDIVCKLGSASMRDRSHGIDKYGAIPITKAAERQAAEFLAQHHQGSAAITLMSVVLAANRNYNLQVAPHVRRMRQQWPDLNLMQLRQMLSERDFQQFKDVWGHADKKKYDVLCQLVDAALSLPSCSNDYERLHRWAAMADLSARRDDPLGRIPNVGIATFQHLRMVFGVDTVKPDQRVREVLANEFGARLSPALAIDAIEEIARITGKKVVEVDQIFVKYGSGYYVKD